MKILWRISIKEERPELLATLFSNKFGDDIVNIDDALSRFIEIKNMGVSLEGIHFHCGSGQQGSNSFKKAVDLARACMEVGRHCGHTMETLDIGGGFPSAELSESIVNALEDTRNDKLGYRVIAEPGRHFSGNVCTLATRVLGKRVKNGKTCYHLNESLYHSFNCILMDGFSFDTGVNSANNLFYKSWEVNQGEKSENTQMIEKTNMKQGSLFGMTCDGMDILNKNLLLPEMEVGDWIVIGGMGAYTYGVKSLFNGMKSTDKIVVFKNEKIHEEKIRFKL
jgi:diaminopimelate decarboxylase